jgi:hypothetical protein
MAPFGVDDAVREHEPGDGVGDLGPDRLEAIRYVELEVLGGWVELREDGTRRIEVADALEVFPDLGGELLAGSSRRLTGPGRQSEPGEGVSRDDPEALPSVLLVLGSERLDRGAHLCR